MAIALVGSWVSTQSTLASISTNLNQTPTSGNLLVGMCCASVATADTTADGGVTFEGVTTGVTNVLHVNISSASFRILLIIGWKISNGLETVGNVPLTGTSTITQCARSYAEFSGADASPQDQSGSGSGTSSPFVQATAAADAASGDLVVSVSMGVFTKAASNSATDTYNNGATATTIVGSGGGFTDTLHSYGFTTGNAAADQNSHASGSMNLERIAVALASFKASGAAAALQPRPTAVDFADPAVFMGAPAAIRRAWHRRRSGIFVPEYAI